MAQYHDHRNARLTCRSRNPSLCRDPADRRQVRSDRSRAQALAAPWPADQISAIPRRLPRGRRIAFGAIRSACSRATTQQHQDARARMSTAGSTSPHIPRSVRRGRRAPPATHQLRQGSDSTAHGEKFQASRVTGHPAGRGRPRYSAPHSGLPGRDGDDPDDFLNRACSRHLPLAPASTSCTPRLTAFRAQGPPENCFTAPKLPGSRGSNRSRYSRACVLSPRGTRGQQVDGCKSAADRTGAADGQSRRRHRSGAHDLRFGAPGFWELVP